MLTTSSRPQPPAQHRSSATMLADGRTWESAGHVPEAIACYEAAIAAAEHGGNREGAVLAEALRRLGILVRQRDDPDRARELCSRSFDVALEIGNDLLAAEALNTIGGLHLTRGFLEDARQAFLQALELGRSSRALLARVEQNLGILANIQGQLEDALIHYQRSLEAYRVCEDHHGCAIAYHNLGMVSADRELLAEAEQYLRESHAIAERTHDWYLQGLCLVSHAEVDVARQRFENAREKAESALGLFEQLGAHGTKAEAYRVLGMVYRETGRPELAESRFRMAMEVAAGAGSVLNEAQAARELALVYQATARNQEALRLLNFAYDRFRRLDARRDLVHVGGKVAELEGTYLAVVRAWGESLESSDSYTFGHCERVARNAVAVARALGLDAYQETTILLGAYLHDLGKVRIPPEILRKPGPLTRDERAIVERHPIWGIELLADVDFPWDLKPIIRSHHERCDGTGYPEGLCGDDIPCSAQIVGILDAYDGLTTPRPYHAALPVERAVAQILKCRTWWSQRVVTAFLEVVTRH